MTRRPSDHYGDRRSNAKPIEDLPLFGGTPAPEPVVHQVEVRAHLRSIPGERPATGAERRDAALSDHLADDAKRTAVTYLRTELEALYRTRCVDPKWRTDPFVTADDIEHLLRHWAACPSVLHEIPGHWKGSVFNRSTWMQTGRSVNSIRPRMNATSLPCWRLRDAAQERAS